VGKGRTSKSAPAGELVRVGQLDLLQEMVKDAPPLNPTRAQAKIIQAAVEMYQESPDPDDLAFLARELVQCTLPHSDPGQVPFWARTNGNLTLSIVSGFDPVKTRLVGYPYGSIPRLILFWVTTESLRTRSRRLELGVSYNDFLRDIGFDPGTGGGKRSDAKRVKEQTRRLFASTISFIQSGELLPGREGERRLNMSVAAASELWWDPKQPDQVAKLEADLGASDGRWVVVQSGLKEGDQVVLGGIYPLKLSQQEGGAQAGHFEADGTFHTGKH